ncbi:ABC transporter ATP-binding protein [Aliiruegeria lutimaris]|uniref:Putative spermidine/putrescine transport system ATP-binding protein n=1 Tax=Aliiruegeria lutimaris TaxID=571298 RepID=A0A1G9ERV3_9RHOB|nr:ABC transporter ATP-binding protein [Aliiruegeria lutimaris]SDK78745.1 putative spermidine/putrescine transport system ATP-binding protein [Aliiruegeria lutimaris]
MSSVEFKGVSKAFGRTVAVEQTDLVVQQGEFFSMLGPSGCGKSTTLRMLAGFLTPTTGRILVNGRDITDLPPEARGIGIVFQNYAIFPHMNVYDNIAFGLVERRQDKATIRRKVEAALEQVGLTGYGERFERELSGGQKQRVALARVLVIEPEILLLDEPLSALDKKMREEMKFWIKDIQKSIGITTVYVTHDQSEALTMSDRIAVMNEGRMLQVGTPVDIYEKPASRFIAEFIGDSNLLDVTVVKSNGTRCDVDLGDGLIVPAHVSDTVRLTPGSSAGLLIRPEMLRLAPALKGEGPRLTGKVVDRVYQGALRRYHVAAGRHELVVEVPNRPELSPLSPGAEVQLFWSEESGVAVP